MDRLVGVHPDLATKILRILDAMRILGWDLRVTQGLRSDKEQAALYAQGRTAPGPRVTNCDGVTSKSKHQRQADGHGHAVDVVFWVKGGPSWDDKLPWGLYGAMGQALGLTWGGSWRTLKDSPHLELP